MKKEEITYYKNGFVARLHNRRIECLKRDDGGYNLIFIRFSKETFTQEQLNHFNVTKSIMGGTFTIAYVRLSEEALSFLSEGWILHNNFNKKMALPE